MEYTGERIIPEHDGNVGQGNIYIHDLMYREFMVAVDNKIALDIACGCGMGTKMLAERASKVHAYDISEESIAFAKEYYNLDNIEYKVGDIRDIPEEDNFFDTAISIETFEHVIEIEKIIDEIHRVLKPNGIWCFTTPNGERYPDHKVVKYHVRHYSEEELHKLLDDRFEIYIRKTGFELDSTLHKKKPTFGNYSAFCVKK